LLKLPNPDIFCYVGFNSIWFT